MKQEYDKLPPCGEYERVPLYPGIELTYLSDLSDPNSSADRSSPWREPLPHTLQVYYCRAGQMIWETDQGSSAFLNPGDFSVHTPGVRADPTGRYQGLAISVDMWEAAAHPPESIAEADIFDGPLREKFYRDRTVAFLAGNDQTERIFAGFYDQPKGLRLAYQRVKTLELLLYLSRMEFAPKSRLAEYPAEQIALVREIHDRFLQHIGQRVTIEELSRQYHVNPTTLKAVFKAVYGSSLAAHIKKHRMEQAARLLRETNMSMAEIAAAVGYESQSKFASAFKNQFAALPTVYRKRG